MEASHLDPIDVQLLEILQHDATHTLDELGETVGLSGSAVQRRIKQHERSGLIRTIAAQLDPDMALVPMTVLTLVTIERDTGPDIESLHQRIYDHPNVQQCYEVAGLFDLALVVTARTMADYRRITGELLDADANVRRFVSHVTLGTVKASLAVPLEPKSV